MNGDTPKRNGLTVKVGMHTPWGVADSVTPIIDGMWSVGTPSHGGIYLRPDLNAQIPDYMQHGGEYERGLWFVGWYEEDCDWCIPFLVFEGRILMETRDPYAVKNINEGAHKRTLKNWHPAAWERFFGVELQPGESYIRDQETFNAENAARLVVVAATGHPCSYLPTRPGFCYCLARIGGHGQTNANNGTGVSHPHGRVRQAGPIRVRDCRPEQV